MCMRTHAGGVGGGGEGGGVCIINKQTRKSKTWDLKKSKCIANSI